MTSNDYLKLGRLVILDDEGEELNPKTVQEWVTGVRKAGWLDHVDKCSPLSPAGLKSTREALAGAIDLTQIASGENLRLTKISATLRALDAELAVLEHGVISKGLQPNVFGAYHRQANHVHMDRLRGKVVGAIDVLSHFMSKLQSYQYVAQTMDQFGLSITKRTVKNWYEKTMGDEDARVMARLHISGRLDALVLKDIDLKDWKHGKYIWRINLTAASEDYTEFPVAVNLLEAKSLFEAMLHQDIEFAKTA